MSLSAIIWMVVFLSIVWGGLAALIVVAIRKDRQERS